MAEIKEKELIDEIAEVGLEQNIFGIEQRIRMMKLIGLVKYSELKMVE